MTRNAKITATLLVAALAAAGCTSEKTSQTDPETKRTAKMQPVSLAKPLGDNPLDSTPARPAAPVSYAEGEAAFQAGKFAEAAQIFEQYTVEKPKNAWGYFMLGLSQSRAGDAPKAEKSFEQALTIDPDHLKTLLNFSRVLIDEKKFDEAIVKLARAGDVDPTSVEVHRLLGRAYNGQHNVSDAIDSYRRAIALDPKDAWSMNNLGLILIQTGRPFDAIPLLSGAVELQSNVPTFHNNLGMALEHTGRFTAAAAEYKEALTADSSNEKAKRNLARIETVKVSAEESFDRAAEARRATEVKEATAQ